MVYARRGYHWRRHVFRLGIAVSGSLVGYRRRYHATTPEGFGGVEPHRIVNKSIRQFTVNSGTNILQLQVGGEDAQVQIPNVATLRAKFPEYADTSVDLTWNGPNSRYDATVDAGLTAWLSGRVGSNVKAIVRPIVQ